MGFFSEVIGKAGFRDSQDGGENVVSFPRARSIKALCTCFSIR